MHDVHSSTIPCLQQISPLLTLRTLVQDAALVDRHFGVKLKGVIDTQLLAGLTQMVQAAGGSSDTSSAANGNLKLSRKYLSSSSAANMATRIRMWQAVNAEDESELHCHHSVLL
jgi:hypothetical protein